MESEIYGGHIFYEKNSFIHPGDSPSVVTRCLQQRKRERRVSHGKQSGSASVQNQSSESPPADSLTLLCDDKSSFNNHCSTDKGFYYFTESGEITDDFYGFRLMYVDYATQKEVYLCSDSGCRHNSESCTAVFNADEFGFDSLVFVHEGYLYVLNRDYDQDGTTYFSDDGSNIEPEKKSAELYRMGLDRAHLVKRCLRFLPIQR